MREQFSLEAGTIIASRYEVMEPLGSGAMGAVLKVIDRTLDNEVIALKLLYPHHVHDDVTFGRFRNEVLVARQLTHPNIVRIHDFGRAENGYCFISMEYVRGHSLRWRIYTRDQDPLTLQEMVYFLREICKGLSHAHGKGIIHRDLKPDNVLLSDKGELKITDFGLARTLNVSKGFTETGNAVGTPAYMSPEQISGEAVDARSDIYSLGLIAYEMAVGIRAFSADNWYDLANKHLLNPLPRFASEHGGIPQWYEEFAQVCAAKKKEDRFQDATAALEVLSEHLAEEEPALGGVQPKRKHRPQSPRQRKPRVLSLYQSESSRKRLLVRSNIFSGILFVVFVMVSILGLLRLNPTIHRAAVLQILQLEKSFGSSFPLPHRIVVSNVRFDEKQFTEFVRLGNAEAVELLLEAGMNANLLGEDGKYMLHLALERGHVEVALKLLSHGANVHARDKQERTPLMYAVQLGNMRLVELLLARTTSTNAVDVNGRTVLMYAASSGNVSMVQSILQKGAAVNWKDKSGRTALFSAIEAKEASVVQVLLEAKADVHVGDREGLTPLMYASQLGDLGVVKALVYQGADISRTDRQGQGAGFYATEHEDVARFLKQYKTSREREGVFSQEVQSTTTEKLLPSPNDALSGSKRVKRTRLRVKGKPEGVYETHTLQRLKEVRVQVRNVGDTEAYKVQVVATLHGGKQVTLVGPAAVARGESAYYEAKLDEVVIVTGEITAKVTCENCW